MTHHANARFWRCYQGLPKEIRDLADRNYAVLKADPTHNSLQFKKVGALWSVRIGSRPKESQIETSLPRGSRLSGRRWPEQVQAVVDKTVAVYGTVDIPANNAGISWGEEPA